MANTNCLRSISCPRCQSEGPFRIAVQTIVLMADDGNSDDSQDGHQDWNGDSYCECHACAHSGTVNNFRSPSPTFDAPSPTTPDKATTALILACQNCGWKGSENDADEADNVSLRHSLGDLYSDQECPECQALCYPVHPTQHFPWSLYLTCDTPQEQQIKAAGYDLLKAVRWLLDELGDPVTPQRPSVQGMQFARDLAEQLPPLPPKYRYPP